jgi:hypothetical protein
MGEGCGQLGLDMRRIVKVKIVKILLLSIYQPYRLSDRCAMCIMCNGIGVQAESLKKEHPPAPPPLPLRPGTEKKEKSNIYLR